MSRLKKITGKIIHYSFAFYWKRMAPSIIAERKGRTKPRMLFGPTPIINNKYWSQALKKNGWDSTSLSMVVPGNCKKEDFDLYYDDIIKKYPRLNKWLGARVHPYIVFDYVIKNFDMVCISFKWSFFSDTAFAEKEAFLCKILQLKVVVMPYGSDYWQYSKMMDLSYKFGLMIHYPQYGAIEPEIAKTVNYWNQHADCVLLGGCVDGSSRNDCLIFSYLTIDHEQWKPRQKYSQANGTNETVKIVHTPNHRYIKGTEFLIEAVNDLKTEGLKVDLILIENTPNDRVKEILCNEADILVEKLTYSVYGLSGLEGMSAGIPVISNLENEEITKAYRRYSFLNECPAVSGTPENIKETLRQLVTDPELRRVLGIAGRKYVEKYHTDKAFNFLFENIARKVWNNENINLAILFHPKNKEAFNSSSPFITHPLVKNLIHGNANKN